ncbi:hypothetical protein [Rhodosalinus sp. K401]|uniref:hypothetical protein n=1 Tax=Rhodosalinus sp. K401 TaxID=3239195 RepID=UPI0035255B51
MQTKLHINLTQGIVDVEGDVDFVKAVYDDFKDRLSGAGTPPSTPLAEVNSPQSRDVGPGAGKPKRRTATRKKPAGTDNSTVSISADAPKRDKELDTSKLAAFYGQYSPANAPERILIFLKFLTEELQIQSPNTDQVYTCFLDVKEKPPGAFAQAFRDTSSKKGFINFESAEDITITTKGNNHFEFDLKKKGDE